MSKNLFQDLIKIKTIKKEGALPSEPKQVKTEPRYSLWLVAFFSITFFLFALSFFFSGAKVIVNPKVKDLVLNENLSATKDLGTNNLTFDLVVISGEDSKSIKGGADVDVFLKAGGTVMLYNAFGSSPQNLDIDTRLEGSNGKLYKTKTKTTIPGISKDGTPGSVAVEIYGASAGEEYNSAPLDFKILGFKGTPKYPKFYGRSKGDIIGGFKGKSQVISDSEKANAISDLKATLKMRLLQKATNQIPTGFILYKDAILLNIDNVNVDFNAKDSMIPLNLKGTLYGFLFDEKKLTKKIVTDLVPDYDDSDVYLQNIKDLKFAFSKNEILSAELKDISFNLSGNSKVVWQIDQEKLLTDILGKKKNDFNQILSQYPNILSADLTLRPFWKSSLPENAKAIQMIVNYPK